MTKKIATKKAAPKKSGTCEGCTDCSCESGIPVNQAQAVDVVLTAFSDIYTLAGPLLLSGKPTKNPNQVLVDAKLYRKLAKLEKLAGRALEDLKATQRAM